MSVSMNEATTFSILQGIVGSDLAERVRNELGGESVYVPKRPSVDADVLRAEFDEVLPGAASVCSAYEAVGRHHGVSGRTVRRMLATVGALW